MNRFFICLSRWCFYGLFTKYKQCSAWNVNDDSLGKNMGEGISQKASFIVHVSVR